MAQSKVQDDVKRIIESKNQFYKLLNDKVTKEAQDAQKSQIMQEAIQSQTASNQKQNTYLSKRYAEFYNLMLHSEGNTVKALKPVEEPPQKKPPAGYSRPPLGPPQTTKLTPSLLYANKHLIGD